jgi:hypothetical protein
LDEGDCCKDRVSDQPSFEKISFGKFNFVYLYKTYYAKHSTSLYSVSIVKRRHLLFPNFRSPRKKGEIQKKSQKIYSKENKKIIIVVRRGCRSAQKMAKRWLRKFKNTKIEI